MGSLAAGGGTGLLVFLGAVSFDLAAADLTAPRPGRCTSLLDELLETPEVPLDAHIVRAEHVTDALGDVLRFPVHLELDLRLALAERDEAHDALVAAFSSSRFFASRGERVGG